MNKIIHCLFLVVGIILGVHLSVLFGDTDTSAVKVSPVFVNPAVLQRTAAAKEALYVQKMDSLIVLNKQLSRKVINTNNTLVTVKRQNSALQEQVYGIINDYNSTTDTIHQLLHCDSLQLAVHELLIADQAKDSLYEDLTTDLSLQITNRDSTIGLQHLRYLTLHSSFDSLVHQQQPILEQNMQLHHLIKKQRKKSKLLSTGAILLSAVAIYGLIQR